MSKTDINNSAQPLGGSKLGRRPIELPNGVQVTTSASNVIVKGPKGELTCLINSYVGLEINDKTVKVLAKEPFSKPGKAFHGLFSRLINNMIIGVSEGFKKTLLLVGTGYRAKVNGNQLEMTLGYSHPINMSIPKEITCSVEDNNTKVILQGFNKEQLGQFAADIRKKRSPEPYKGKGIRYENEVIRKKAGKSGKSKK